MVSGQRWLGQQHELLQLLHVGLAPLLVQQRHHGAELLQQQGIAGSHFVVPRTPLFVMSAFAPLADTDTATTTTKQKQMDVVEKQSKRKKERRKFEKIRKKDVNLVS